MSKAERRLEAARCELQRLEARKLEIQYKGAPWKMVNRYMKEIERLRKCIQLMEIMNERQRRRRK